MKLFTIVIAFAGFMGSSVASDATEGYYSVNRPLRWEKLRAGEEYKVTWDASIQRTGSVTFALVGGETQGTLQVLRENIGTVAGNQGWWTWKVDPSLGHKRIYGLKIMNSTQLDMYQWSNPFIVIPRSDDDITTTMLTTTSTPSASTPSLATSSCTAIAGCISSTTITTSSNAVGVSMSTNTAASTNTVDNNSLSTATIATSSTVEDSLRTTTVSSNANTDSLATSTLISNIVNDSLSTSTLTSFGASITSFASSFLASPDPSPSTTTSSIVPALTITSSVQSAAHPTIGPFMNTTSVSNLAASRILNATSSWTGAYTTQQRDNSIITSAGGVIHSTTRIGNVVITPVAVPQISQTTIQTLTRVVTVSQKGDAPIPEASAIGGNAAALPSVGQLQETMVVTTVSFVTVTPAPQTVYAPAATVTVYSCGRFMR